MVNFQQTPKPKMCCCRNLNIKPAIVYVLLFLGCCMHLQVESIKIDLSPSIEERSERLMRFLSDPASNFNHNRRVGPGPGPGQLPRIRASIDNIHPPTAWRPPGPQLIRREFNGNYPVGGNNQNTRFAHSKDAAVLDVGKNQFYRTKDIQPYNHHSNQYTQNFKASPNFNAVKNNELTKYPSYAPIQQHAIPVEANKYLGFNQGQAQVQGQSLGYNDVLNKQHNQFGQNVNSYAVYEDNENVAKTAANFGQNYQQTAAVVPQKLTKAAEDYLHFMGTNEYFLPRHDPNYKQLDVERDQIKYQQQKQKESQQQQQYQQEYQKHQQQQQHQQQQHQHHHQQSHYVLGDRHLSDTSASSTYNKPLRVADLFYQQDPAPPDSAVVRGSYQAGQNSFVVKSDGNKSVKHILSSKPTPPQSQTPPPTVKTYTQSWHSAHKTETPEPVRFEFTEHDAIKGSASYTNAPHGQKFYYETHPSTPAAPLLENPKPVQELTKDNTEYVNKNTQEQPILEPATASADSKETVKDNEAYCEKICANVYDENDEIVCGSDGYMYTGESQLECYSSCLNIEVSIKSKGSCS